jgi:FtsP/CotA-like multicopper oxidase with cupredoxin domain
MITHTDGYPVQPMSTDALLIGMGERFDVEFTAGDGLFPLVASAEGKTGQAVTLLRSGSGSVPAAALRPVELTRQVLLGTDLHAAAAAALTNKNHDRTLDLVLAGAMSPYRWTINGQAFPDATPLPVTRGERVRLKMINRTMMFHPMHLHGHTFAVAGGGPRKDTVIVRPMDTVLADLDADNPGQWAIHCHNIYHAESGMMTTLSYR